MARRHRILGQRDDGARRLQLAAVQPSGDFLHRRTLEPWPAAAQQMPAGRQRKVLNLYYYTTVREDGDAADPHFTLYKRRRRGVRRSTAKPAPAYRQPTLRRSRWSWPRVSQIRRFGRRADAPVGCCLDRPRMEHVEYEADAEAALSKIHYSKPSIGQLEVEYAADAAANGWAEKCFDYFNRFEKEFARMAGRQAHRRHQWRDRRVAPGPRGARNISR